MRTLPDANSSPKKKKENNERIKQYVLNFDYGQLIHVNSKAMRNDPLPAKATI
jgi:hypothetical protein